MYSDGFITAINHIWHKKYQNSTFIIYYIDLNNFWQSKLYNFLTVPLKANVFFPVIIVLKSK